MIYSTNELLKNGETEYSIRNKIQKGKLFLIERGIYSNKAHIEEDEVYICKKYPNAIITGLSALYIYGLTDHIPECFYLATEQHSFPIRRNDVDQSYQEQSFFEIGKTTIKYSSGTINIYSLERLLIEVIRLKEKYSPELYYEVINSFRKIKNKLDLHKIYEYLQGFSNGRRLLQRVKELI